MSGLDTNSRPVPQLPGWKRVWEHPLYIVTAVLLLIGFALMFSHYSGFGFLLIIGDLTCSWFMYRQIVQRRLCRPSNKLTAHLWTLLHPTEPIPLSMPASTRLRVLIRGWHIQSYRLPRSRRDFLALRHKVRVLPLPRRILIWVGAAIAIFFACDIVFSFVVLATVGGFWFVIGSFVAPGGLLVVCIAIGLEAIYELETKRFARIVNRQATRRLTPGQETRSNRNQIEYLRRKVRDEEIRAITYQGELQALRANLANALGFQLADRLLYEEVLPFFAQREAEAELRNRRFHIRLAVGIMIVSLVAGVLLTKWVG